MELSKIINDLCKDKKTIGSTKYFRVLEPNLLEEFIDSDFFYLENAVCFAISVFAEFLCEVNNEILYIDPTRRINFKVCNSNEINDVLDNDQFLNETHYNLFDEAKQRLGLPNESQCYGFVPMLHIGGRASASSLDLVNWEVHLHLLTGCMFF